MFRSLKGQVLLASRRLVDPNFVKSIVLLVQHGEEGALGLVLNRPLNITVKQACEQVLDEPFIVDGLLYQGGPCQGPLMAVHRDRENGDNEITDELFFSSQRSSLEELLKQQELTIKYFVGYAGWGPGQLENELESDSWLVTGAITPEQLTADLSWSRLISRATLSTRIDPRLIPDDPSVN